MHIYLCAEWRLNVFVHESNEYMASGASPLLYDADNVGADSGKMRVSPRKQQRIEKISLFESWRNTQQ